MRIAGTMTVLVAAAVVAIASSAYPAERSRADVQSLIERTQKKVDLYRTTGAAEIIAQDLGKIEDHIASARRLLENGSVDQSYYEISIGIIYFMLVDSRIELSRAETEIQRFRQKMK